MEGIKFIKKNGHVIPLKIGPGKSGPGKYSKLATKIGKRTIAYGSVAGLAYGTKKSWDNASEKGKYQMVGAAAGLAVSAHNLNKVRKDSLRREVLSAMYTKKPKATVVGMAIGTAINAGLGAAIGSGVGSIMTSQKKKR